MRIVVIGGGFGGLASATLLAASGHTVSLYEKNENLGGKAGMLEVGGFRFDTGPSWYLMPEVFKRYFALLKEKPDDYYTLTRLDPAYRVFYENELDAIDIHSDQKKDKETFEAIEHGSHQNLKRYLHDARYKYDVSMQRFLYKNYDKITDFITPEVLREAPKLQLFQKMHPYVRGFFKNEKLQKIMEYPLVFLGASPYNAPALYSLMSHVDFNQGVFYPDGGIYKVTEAMVALAKKHGVVIHTNAPVKKILTEKKKAAGIELETGEVVTADIVISNTDRHFTENVLLPEKSRDHSKRYWKKRTLAPSALLLYLGVQGKLPTLTHHNLLFSSDWKKNFAQIFDAPAWPEHPSLYVCKPSETDPSVAPADCENLFVLVPIAPGLKYTQAELDKYIDHILETIERNMHVPALREKLVVKRSFCVKDFEAAYNSFRGSALGLAHTLRQSALWRPNNVNKKVRNLYYVGADTNPGIGLPMTLISAELVVKRIASDSSAGPLKKLPKVKRGSF